MIRLLLAFAVVAGSEAMAVGFTHVQGGVGTTAAGNTLTLTLTSNPTTGNLVACGATGPYGATITQVRDGNSNSYTMTPYSPVGNPNGSPNTWLFYLLNAPSNANKTITVTYSSSPSAYQVWCDEFSVSGGTASFDLDVTGVGTATGGNVYAPSITPTGGGELLYSTCDTSSAITAVNSPWTVAGGGISGGNAAAYVLSGSTTTAINFTDSVTNDPFACMEMAFKFSAGGAGPPKGFNHLQGGLGNTIAGNTVTVGLNHAPVQGHLLACTATVFAGASTAITSVSGGFVVAASSSYVSGAGQSFDFYQLSVPPSAPSSITVTFAATPSLADVWCDEFSYFGGVAAADASATASGSTGTTINTPIVTPSVAGDLFYAGCANSNNISSVNSPWITSAGGVDSGDGFAAGYSVDPTAGSLGLNMTQTSGNSWSCASMALKLVPVRTSFPILQ